MRSNRVMLVVLLSGCVVSGCATIGENVAPRSSWNWATQETVEATFAEPGTEALVRLRQDSDETLSLDGRPSGCRVRGEERVLLLDEARRAGALGEDASVVAVYSLDRGTRLPGSQGETTALIVVQDHGVGVLTRGSGRWIRCYVSQGSHNAATFLKVLLVVGGTLAVAAVIVGVLLLASC